MRSADTLASAMVIAASVALDRRAASVGRSHERSPAMASSQPRAVSRLGLAGTSLVIVSTKTLVTSSLSRAARARKVQDGEVGLEEVALGCRSWC